MVAVFAGTTSALTNYFKETRHTTTSRDAVREYHSSGTQLYEPFIHLATTGIFASGKLDLHREMLTGGDDESNEYRVAIDYGHPLFAVLQQESSISTAHECVILFRMLLSRIDWFHENISCLSILATRVQMGQTSSTVASELVQCGYVTLTSFSVEDGVTHISHLLHCRYLCLQKFP